VIAQFQSCCPALGACWHGSATLPAIRATFTSGKFGNKKGGELAPLAVSRQLAVPSCLLRQFSCQPLRRSH
jgi:hypothetical protein